MPEGPNHTGHVKHDNLPAENPHTLSCMEPVWETINSSCTCETFTSSVAYATQRRCSPLEDDFSCLWVNSSHTFSCSLSPKMPGQAVPPLQLQRSAISWLIPMINQNGCYHVNILQIQHLISSCILLSPKFSLLQQKDNLSILLTSTGKSPLKVKIV